MSKIDSVVELKYFLRYCNFDIDKDYYVRLVVIDKWTQFVVESNIKRSWPAVIVSQRVKQ